jgi:DHA1 family bicyclomycin/chloramphenicol resistance-like MFS transporter
MSVNDNPQKKLSLVLILGALTGFTAISIDMYLPGFPQMAEDLHVPIGTIQLTVSAFLIGSSVGQIFYGPLSDRWGRKRPLLAGSALYVIATIGCALSDSASALIFWRVVMALGGGAGLVIARAVVRDLYNTIEAARMFSLLMLVMGAAPILAPLAGAQVLLFTGWRGIFFCLSLFGTICFVAVAGFLPETLAPERRLKHSIPHLATLYGQLFKNPQYLCYAVGLGSVSGLTFAYISGAPFLFIELHGISPQHFSLFFSFTAIGLIAASQLNRKLLQYYAVGSILKAALLLNLFSAGLLLFTVATDIGGFSLQYLFLFTNVATTGLLYPNVTALTLAPFKQIAGSASALMGTIQYAMGAGAGILVSLFQHETAIPMAATMTGFSILGLLCAHILPGRLKPAQDN